MTIFTHVPFGLLTAEFACSSFGYDLDTPALALAALASALPDIDHPRSVVGFLLRPTGLPQWLEQRLGHRSITHSWIFLLAVMVLFIPLWMVWGLLGYMAAWFGVLSHLLIDMANVSGVPLWWPHRVRWVFPAAEEYRLNTGSVGEAVLATIIVLTVSAFTPVSRMGMSSAFYLLTKDIYNASREARKFFPTNEITVQVRGTWRDRQVPTDYNELFRGLAVEQNNIFFARGDAVFASGGAEPSMTIDQIYVKRGAPTTRVSASVELDQQLVDEIGDRVPDGAIVSGRLKVELLDQEQKTTDYVTTSEEFATVRFDRSDKETEEIVLTYCPAERFRKALLGRNIFVRRGVLTITTSTEGERRHGRLAAAGGAP